jgi:hypothetical protein
MRSYYAFPQIGQQIEEPFPVFNRHEHEAVDVLSAVEPRALARLPGKGTDSVTEETNVD